MLTTKLGTCFVAAAITLAGATHLARPVQAAETMTECTPTQKAYARGFADGSCGGGGILEDCQQTSGGGFYFIWSCEPT